ncbi:alpha/beta fold hydrolase [Aeromicrobium sp. CTD01-1L150]|uniref:alpha/beta fold hydrolase n=1 Tax=Aeromicrobium sp. CTD01-1L150 TaxID=3341830 RepID=UPI0035C2352E
MWHDPFVLPDLAYTRRGPEGAVPVVLLHGIGHRRQAWEPVIDRLAERYDVIAPDLSGFGQSPAFAGEVVYSMDNACDHLLTQFEQWGISKPHVVGNSLGGAIALELGSRGLASSVTALSPAGFFGPLNRLQALIPLLLMRLLAFVTPKVVLRRLAETPLGRRIIGLPLYAHPERHDAEATYGDSLALKHATAFERTAAAAITYRFDHQVPAPVTVAWGTKDRLLPYAQAGTARARLPHARHEPLPGAGHVPMADDPELVVRLIEQTIAEGQRPALAR